MIKDAENEDRYRREQDFLQEESNVAVFQIQRHNRIEFCSMVWFNQHKGQVGIGYAQHEKEQKHYEQP